MGECDILIKNAMIADGTGKELFYSDVAVCGNIIDQVSANINSSARFIIDARGKILCPGFIDAHSHSDISLIYDGGSVSKLTQGITTEVIGNCGYSAYPISEDAECAETRRRSLGFIDVEGVDWDWNDAKGYFEKITLAKPNVNLLSLVGHGSIRSVAMGFDERKASTSEIEEMCFLLGQCFQQGAGGLSTGLGYAPDFYSDTNELTALANVVKKYNKIFSFHIRGERGTFIKAINEAIKVGKDSGAQIEISHLKCAGEHNHEKSAQVLEMIDEARSKGVDIGADIYPYMAGSAYLGLVFPPWMHSGGMKKLLERLSDIDLLRRITHEMKNGNGEWSSLTAEQNGKNLIMVDMKNNKELVGKSLYDIALLRGTDVNHAAAQLMLEEDGNANMIMIQQLPDDIQRIMRHDSVVFGTDGLAMNPIGNIIRDMPHPRSYGSFPKLIREYVYDKGVLTLEEAIHKSTLKTANRFSISKRGCIANGFFADIVIFNPETIKDNATYINPHRICSGVDYVFVNGILAVENGNITGSRAGMLIKRR